MPEAGGAGFLENVVPFQICTLVPNIEVALRMWSKTLGRTDWRLYHYSPDWVPEWEYRERPGTYSMMLAIVGQNPQIELIEPLSGPSIYHEWIEEHGYGPHHIGFRVDSILDLMASARAAGVAILQSGRGYGLDGDGGFAYLDTEATHGVLLEAIETPTRRAPSLPLPSFLV